MWPSWQRSGKQHGSARRRPGFRPTLEVLEDRCVPSTLKHSPPPSPTLVVTNNLDDGSMGSLRYEIAAANPGATIVFAPSLDGQTITLRASELDINKNLNIQGPGASLLTISGGRGVTSTNGVRVFAVEYNAAVTLSGLTITGGFAKADNTVGNSNYFDNDGGGILNLGTLTVSGCTVSGNYADPVTASSYGGGIYNAGRLTVSNSTVSGNFATFVSGDPVNQIPANQGGGIYNAAGATLTVSNTTVSNNFANNAGGGIYNAGTAAALTVLDSIFSSNHPDNIYGPYTDGGGNTFH